MKLLIFTMFLCVGTELIWAMDNNETVDSKIIKVMDENIIVLNRGVEDGISRGDHGKITHTNGFIARGIAVNTGMMTSHWKIYRVAYPEKVSKDLTYTLTNINSSKIPEKYADFKEEDTSEEYRDTPENELIEEAKEKATEKIAVDLPDDLSDHGLEEPEKLSFADEQFNGEVFLNDLRKWAITLSAAPLSYNTDRGDRNLNYSVGINNTANEKYELGINASNSFNYTLQKDFYGKVTETKSADESLSIAFAITRVTERLSWTAELSWSKSFQDDKMTGGSSDIKPFGLRYAIVQAARGSWNISWSPSYTKQYSVTEDFNGNEKLEENILLRHYINTDFSFRFNEKFDFANRFSFAPIQDTVDWGKFDFKNVQLNNDFNLNYYVSRYFNISFNYNYRYDITQAAYGFANEHIYSTNFNLNFEI